jgi:hypothetical protein
MSIRNQKIFGLTINSRFVDVENKELALSSINLSSLDLDVIRGSSNAGATRGDWISFSGLKFPIYKNLDRYYNSSENYSQILSEKAGFDSILFGDLKINGSLNANSIRYRYIDGTGTTATIKIADISTSRQSAWSSNDSPIVNTSPISYGARVGIITDGSLQFGTQSPSLSGPRLKTRLVPQVKEFNSEFPTHKINCSIGGQTVSIYAMKGIPVVFTGFFRNLTATVSLTSLINNIPASWKIVDTDNPNIFSKFSNIGGLSSTINYTSVRSKERFIQIYYNPDNITSITINNSNISSIPTVKFQNLITLNLGSNSLKTFPDFNFIAPNIQRIFLGSNPFNLSQFSGERTLNSNVTNKIPVGIKELHLGATFNGSITQNLLGNRFTQLQVLNLSRNAGPYFYPDNLNPTSPLPNVSNTCETYNVRNNDFRTINDSSGDSKNIKELTNLISLDLGGNYNLTDSNFNISPSNIKIQSINISGTNLPSPNLSGRQSLVSFDGRFCRNIGSFFDGQNYKFDGCNALSTLNFNNSNLTGAIPRFTNINLSYLDLRFTSLTGGSSSGDNTYVIPEKTFQNSTNLQYFLLRSTNLLTSPIHPNAFSYTPKIFYIEYTSGGKTTGQIPSLVNNPALSFLITPFNAFTGNCPNFISNPNISNVDLSRNKLSGIIPAFKNLSALVNLYLFNNEFTELSKFQNLTRLSIFQAHNNQIGGQIPDFEGCPNISQIILFNNRFTDYTLGALSKNFRLRYVDLSNNLLSQQAINLIINDLFSNYNTVNRGGVTVNLRGNTGIPSGIALERVNFLISKGWNITYI